jgi:hypothetical protein
LTTSEKIAIAVTITPANEGVIPRPTIERIITIPGSTVEGVVAGIP